MAGEQARARKAAEDEAAKERGKSKDAIAQLDKIAETYKTATADFKSLNESLPKDFTTKVDDDPEEVRRTQSLVCHRTEKDSRDELVASEDAKNKAEREKKTSLRGNRQGTTEEHSQAACRGANRQVRCLPVR